MAGNYYSNCSTLTTGCFLYITPTTTPAINGKYSDGTNCYTVSGNNGEITSVESCTTYYYYNATQWTDCNSSSGSYVLRSTFVVNKTWVCADIGGGDYRTFEILSSASGPSYNYDITSEFNKCLDVICP